MGGDKEKSSKECADRSSEVIFAVPHLFLSFLGKVGEYLKRLNFSQHRKWNVEPLTVPQQWNPPSLFLSSYMRPITHRQLVKRASEGPLWALAGLSGSCLFLTVLLQMITTSPLRYCYPQDSLDLKQATELWDTTPSTPPIPKILYSLLSSQYIWLYIFLPFLSAVLPWRPLF